MFLFFLRQQYFLLFCFMSAAPIVRPSFFMHAHFSIGTSRALFSLLALCLFRTFKISGVTKYGFCLVYGTWYFFFRVATHNYDQHFFKAPILTIKSLRVRPWCAHKCYFTSTHNHGIPTNNSFLATRSSLHPLRFPQSVTFCSMLNDRLLCVAARCFLFTFRSLPILFLGEGGRRMLKKMQKTPRAVDNEGELLTPQP